MLAARWHAVIVDDGEKGEADYLGCHGGECLVV